MVVGGGSRGGAVVVGGGYRGGYSGGYRSGYYGGGYRSGYYGGYGGLYGPGYFGGVGVYVAPSYAGYYSPSLATPDYDFPSQPPVVTGNPNPGDAGPPQEPPPPDGTAGVTVVVPPDADVWFNGDPTQQKGEQREFITPVLPVGRAYQYEVRARWKVNGQAVDQSRTIIVHSNQRTVVDFTRAEPIGAPIPVPGK